MYPLGWFSTDHGPPIPKEHRQQLDEFLVQLRLLDVDAVGIFGSLQDKQGILNERRKPWIRGHQPAPLIFTTDADLSWDGFPYDGSVLISSLIDPHDPDTAELATHAFGLLSRSPVPGVQPDVYMLQARRAAQFLFRVVRHVQQTDSRARQEQPWELTPAAVFDKHRGRREP